MIITFFLKMGRVLISITTLFYYGTKRVSFCKIFKNVNSQSLIDTLKDLKENRRLSSESEDIMESFVGNTDQFSFSFIESSSTFSSRINEKYAKGKTIIANFIDSELECSIMFPSSKNAWVDGLSKGDKFSSDVVVLKLDNLYQRVVFRTFQAGEKEAERELDTNEKSPHSKSCVEPVDEPVIQQNQFDSSAELKKTPEIEKTFELVKPKVEVQPKVKKKALLQKKKILNFSENKGKRFKIGSKLKKISVVKKITANDEFSTRQILFRVVVGSIFGMLGIGLLAMGWIIMTTIFLAISWYMFSPVVKNIER